MSLAHSSSAPRCSQRGAAMPIGRLLEPGVFEPEQVAMLARVFDDLRQALGLADQTDRVTRMIAGKLVGFARAGERDPERLKQLTLAALRR
jgi:hypothetical protein